MLNHVDLYLYSKRKRINELLLIVFRVLCSKKCTLIFLMHKKLSKVFFLKMDFSYNLV